MFLCLNDLVGATRAAKCPGPLTLPLNPDFDIYILTFIPYIEGWETELRGVYPCDASLRPGNEGGATSQHDSLQPHAAKHEVRFFSSYASKASLWVTCLR